MSNAVEKCFVLDTNVLLSDPSSIYSFEEHNVVIPLIVLEELDRQKSRQDEVGKSARAVARELDDLRATGNLFDGIRLAHGTATGILQIKSLSSTLSFDKLPPELRTGSADNIIISLAKFLTDTLTSKKVVLVSKDINVRLKADSIGVVADDYLKMRVATDKEHIYGGVMRLDVPADVLETFYTGKKVDAVGDFFDVHEFQPNQFVVMKDVAAPGKSAIGRFVLVNGMPTIQQFRFAREGMTLFGGLAPKNKEQLFALELLLDPNVKLVTLLGAAGTGKTLLSVAAGLNQVNGISGVANAPYSKLIVTRPIQPLGKDIGFLPGTLEEKMDPWISPIKDSLNFLFGKPKAKREDETMLSMHLEKKKIEIEALTYIRGRSIPDSFIIIDEAQNLSVHELKTIITRVSEGTKIVLTGDIEQIDNTHVDVYSNGLTHAVEKFKYYPISGHVTMRKGERSELASLAASIL